MWWWKTLYPVSPATVAFSTPLYTRLLHVNQYWLFPPFLFCLNWFIPVRLLSPIFHATVLKVIHEFSGAQTSDQSLLVFTWLVTCSSFAYFPSLLQGHFYSWFSSFFMGYVSNSFTLECPKLRPWTSLFSFYSKCSLALNVLYLLKTSKCISPDQNAFLNNLTV